MKNFLLFVFLVGFVFSITNLVIADTSNIAKLVFITEPQTVAPNEISKYITLQIQDASGSQVTAPETIRFDAFQSTSQTGTFVSCTTPTNPPTDYMSKNSSNKNICYKDSTEGVYTITAKTNNTVNSLVATQEITISSTPPSGNPGNNSTTLTALIAGTGSGTISGVSNPYEKGATAEITAVPSASSTFTGWSGDCTTTSETCSVVMDSNKTVTANFSGISTISTTPPISSGGGGSYVYSSSVYLSTDEPLSLNVQAGRERLAFLHTPVEFKSYALDKKTGKNVSGAEYSWTFGDGASATGNVVFHTYLFPGEYNVVLNSSSGEVDAVDITKVKIIEPKAKVVYVDSYLEFINEGPTDLNIGGWKIKGNDKEYIIPRDTIVSVNKNVKIPSSVLASVFGKEKLSLAYPDNQLALEVSSVPSEERQKQIVEISQRLTTIKHELDLAYAQENGGAQFFDELNQGLASEEGTKEEGVDKGVVSVANSISSPVSQSVVSKIVDFFATMFK